MIDRSDIRWYNKNIDINKLNRSDIMTWLDVYNFLHSKANNVKEIDPNVWSQDVMVHDAETGEERPCDVWEVMDESGEKRLVIAVNDEYFQS